MEDNHKVRPIQSDELSKVQAQHLLWLETKGREGQQANLGSFSLKGADLSRAKLSRACLAGANLSEADLRGVDLTDADLKGVDLTAANLDEANLAFASLEKADLTNASLGGARLFGADLSWANLEEADLRFACLSAANLRGTRLPFNVGEHASYARNLATTVHQLFFSSLIACMMCWLSLSATTDPQLLVNSGSVPLPLVGLNVSTSGFYFVAPMILLILHVYLLAYVQRFWDSVARLPFVFPDGIHLGDKLPPILLTSLGTVRLVPTVLFGASVGLMWLVVPITLIGFWLRYLVRHDPMISAVHCFLVSFSLGIVSFFIFLTYKTFDDWKEGKTRLETLKAAYEAWKGSERRSGRLRVLFFFIVLFILLIVFSTHNIFGKPAVGLPFAYADLREAELSIRPAGHGLIGDDQIDLVKGARLRGANLRYADAHGAFLVRADMPGADLTGAYFVRADMRGANLGSLQLALSWLIRGRMVYVEPFVPFDLWSETEQDRQIENMRRQLVPDRQQVKYACKAFDGAILKNTFLTAARISGARLLCADLEGAHLELAVLDGSDLRYANLAGASLVQAKLSGTRLAGADLCKADLRNTDMRRAVGLTKEQIACATTDAATQLPWEAGLTEMK